ncbi:MAG: N-acetylglucosamine-6-phosphate deacetylase [Dehalococcoidia bacterium]
MLTALTGARVLTPDEEIERGTVLIEDGRILEVGQDVRPPPQATITELPNVTLAPGFIDIHVHGGGGFSLATPDAEEIRAYARWVVAGGVTSFLASVVADTPDGGEACLRSVARVAGSVADGANLIGAHLEGPFVNPSRRGALPESWVRPPDAGLLRRFLDAAAGHLRVITVAPELAGAATVQDEATAAGCVVALGHSDAGYEEAQKAFAAGARHLTHAFNAMRPFHHREPGILGAALDSPMVTVELIADGVHIHPVAARLLLAAKGDANVALITDGVAPAGMSHGVFDTGGREARLSQGRVTLADGTIAGGAATMDVIVRNAVGWGLVPLSDAIRMASTVPARVLGLDGVKGRVAPGYDADLVALDGELDVVMTWVGGRCLHSGRDGGLGKASG